MTKTTLLLPVSAALLALALTGCGQADGDEDGTGSGVTLEPSADATTSADDATTDDAPTDDATTDGATATADGDVTAAGLAAISTAEGEVGGVAYTVDDSDDDGTWEVDVRTGSTSVEVTVAADGTVSRTEEDDLDADDVAAIDAATVTLAEAIGAAVDETGGVLDDAELSDDDGAVHYEVSVRGADGAEVDVHVDAATGDVIRTQ